MKIKKIILFLFSFIALNGCVETTAFLGPAITIGNSGNVYQASISYASNNILYKTTGKSAIEHVTSFLDPDNEFLWEDKSVELIQQRFVELVQDQSGKELSDYTLRKIGSDLESYIRKMLQSGELSYNPDCRVLNYSMGLPRTPDLL